MVGVGDWVGVGDRVAVWLGTKVGVGVWLAVRVGVGVAGSVGNGVRLATCATTADTAGVEAVCCKVGALQETREKNMIQPGARQFLKEAGLMDILQSLYPCVRSRRSFDIHERGC